MIGGIVIEKIILANKVWVNCVEAQEESSTKCAIYVERNQESEAIKNGDSFWWQGRFAMWTPFNSPRQRCGVDYDIRIPRIGFSGVSKPK